MLRSVTELTCASLVEGNANWPANAQTTVFAGTSSVSGSCLPGYSGQPTRPCNLDGTWGAITQACVRKYLLERSLLRGRAACMGTKRTGIVFE